MVSFHKKGIKLPTTYEKLHYKGELYQFRDYGYPSAHTDLAISKKDRQTDNWNYRVASLLKKHGWNVTSVKYWRLLNTFHKSFA